MVRIRWLFAGVIAVALILALALPALLRPHTSEAAVPVLEPGDLLRAALEHVERDCMVVSRSDAGAAVVVCTLTLGDDTARVVVRQIPENVRITNREIDFVALHDTVNLGAQVTDRRGHAISPPVSGICYRSLDPTVVQVDTAGNVWGVRAGPGGAAIGPVRVIAELCGG